jgi:uncharacterized phage protein (TIGR01671 family)
MQERILKYRAWDFKDKRMITHEQDFIPLKICSLGVLRLNPHTVTTNWQIIESSDRFSLMQFTGALDKFNKEIYHKDIVMLDEKIFGSKNNIFVVEWDFENYCWDFGGGLPSDMIHRKVIGNVFENPKLLCKKESV